MQGKSQETVAPLLSSLGPTCGQLTVATGTGVSILDASQPTDIGVRVKADDDNTGSIYIGNASKIPTTSAGWRLKAGQELEISAGNVNQIFAIASAGSQKLYWMAR